MRADLLGHGFFQAGFFGAENFDQSLDRSAHGSSSTFETVSLGQKQPLQLMTASDQFLQLAHLRREGLPQRQALAVGADKIGNDRGVQLISLVAQARATRVVFDPPRVEQADPVTMGVQPTRQSLTIRASGFQAGVD